MRPEPLPLAGRRERPWKINTIWLLARCPDPGSYTVTMSPTDPNKFVLTRVNQYGGLHLSRKDVSALAVAISPTDPPTTWKIRMTRPDGGNLRPDELDDLMVVLQYAWGALKMSAAMGARRRRPPGGRR